MTELAETLGTTPEQIALAIRAALPTLSLTPVDDEDGLREFDVPVESPEEALSDRIGLAEVMDRLDSGDRQLIRLRFFAGRTQSETARVLGTTQVQISRRERRILKWMREQLLEAQRYPSTGTRSPIHPPPPIICARQPPSPQYTPCPNFTLKLCRKNQKTCKNLLTKVILLAIIIKLSREPSPRRQPLEPLPTACTPFFEENFFKKLSENLLTNERI